jgi:hypothetical protein
MIETLNDAYTEIKRADHIVYVSLKYTRTADVIRNVVERLIDANSLMISSLIKKLISDSKIVDSEYSLSEKVKLLRDNFPEDKLILDMIEFNNYLRKLSRAEFTGENEYRRHVMMKAIVDGVLQRIDIEKITEYYDKVKAYFFHIRTMILPEEE